MRSRVLTLLLFTAFMLTLLSAQESGTENPVVTAKINGQQVEATFSIPEGYHQTLQKDYFYLDIAETEGVSFEETIYPEGHKDKEGNIEYKGKVTLVKKFTIAREFTDRIETLKIYAGYQYCLDEGSCLFPEDVEFELSLISDDVIESEEEVSDEGSTIEGRSDDFEELVSLLADFEISGKETGYHKSESFISFLQAAKTGNLQENRFADKSIWLIIVLILIGGIALNLTPCVLPMIPITIAVLGAGTQAESKGKGFLIGGVYGLGMALAYGALGLIVVLTGSQFGTINSSPWFNVIIAAFFIVLALAMFDIIPIDFSKFQSGKVGSKSKFITVFILGVIAAVLAGACVAPVLISVILYSTSLYSAGNTAGLLLPFLLGVGMAIPWPFAGAGLSVLPKPGNWMKWVKIIFGIIILVIALLYAFTGYKIFKQSATKVEYAEVEAEESLLSWHHTISEGLKESQLTGKPVFIDFWATWCKNCLAMDASTFKDNAVIDEFGDFVLVKYQAENLKVSPTKEILDHFKIIGLPTYIVLKPQIREGE